MPELKSQPLNTSDDKAEQSRRTLARWRTSGPISTGLFRGVHTHPGFGAIFTSSGSYNFAIDLLSRGSMHFLGTVYTAGGETNFAVSALRGRWRVERDGLVRPGLRDTTRRWVFSAPALSSPT